MLDIHQSVDEILDSEAILGETFYQTFLERYPEVQRFFADVNMRRQAVVLTMALLLIEQYETYRYPAVASFLRDLGARHRDRRIPRELFPEFRDALLDALAAHHADLWNDEVREQWSRAIDRAAAVMLQAYEVGERTACGHRLPEEKH